jgi:hypothetical protein
MLGMQCHISKIIIRNSWSTWGRPNVERKFRAKTCTIFGSSVWPFFWNWIHRFSLSVKMWSFRLGLHASCFALHTIDQHFLFHIALSVLEIQLKFIPYWRFHRRKPKLTLSIDSPIIVSNCSSYKPARVISVTTGGVTQTYLYWIALTFLSVSNRSS